MGGAGYIVKRTVFVVATVLLVSFGAGASASAAGPAKAGSTFITSYLNLPKGAIPGGVGGYGTYGVDRSALSANGRFVAFVAAANSLSRAANPDVINIFRKDRATGRVAFVSRGNGVNGIAPATNSHSPRISGNGNLVAFVTAAPLAPTDLDVAEDVYIRNLTARTTTLATPDTTTGTSDYDISANGQYVAFASRDVLVGTDLNGKSDVFRRNLNNGTVDLISRIPANGTAGDSFSDSPSISGDGRWVAFGSDSNDIAAGFVNHNGSSPDVMVRDMTAGQTYLVSSQFNLASQGANEESREPAIAGTPGPSNEVRIAYSSHATNLALVGVDPSPASSVYLKTSLAAAPSVLVSQSTGGANADSRAHTPRIDNAGNLIFFSSDASNLGAGDDYYGAYLRNVSGGTTVLGSARNQYAIAADISGNGNLIVWGEAGGATPDSDPDAFGVFVRPIPGGAVQFVSRPRGNRRFLTTGAYVGSDSGSGRTISANGRYVTFELGSSRIGAAQGNQIFRRDLATGRLELASRRSGAKGVKSQGSTQPSISADGSRIAFLSYEPLVAADSDSETDAYVRDLRTRLTTLVSRANGPAGAVADAAIESVAISGNGRRVVFETDATNLGVPGGDSQVYVRDLAADTTFVASRANGNGGSTGNSDSDGASISNDGRVVAFRSRATNLDPDDAEPQRDIYVRKLASNTVLLASRLPGLAGANADVTFYAPALSGDGKVVAFMSEDENLVPGTGPWPGSRDQVITRVLRNGVNRLASRSRSGAPSNDGSDSPSLNRNGLLVAFESNSTNLLAGRGGEGRSAVLVKNMRSARVTGPPAFGLVDNSPQQGSRFPSLSDNGRCLAFNAEGHNRASGNSSDIQSSYVYTVSGRCSNPRGIPRPRLGGVRVRGGKRASIRFVLNTRATVVATFKRRAGRRYVAAGRLVRRNQRAGRRVLRKGLRPGRYRVTLIARNGTGRSHKVSRTFRVRRR